MPMLTYEIESVEVEFFSTLIAFREEAFSNVTRKVEEKYPGMTNLQRAGRCCGQVFLGWV